MLGTGSRSPWPTCPERPAADPWLLPLLVFAATWLLILAAWYGSDAIYGHGHPWTWHFLFKDAKYYLAIAEHGYKRTSPFPWGRGPRSTAAPPSSRSSRC